MSKTTLNIGILGAARIVPNALTKPANLLDNVQVRSIAARDYSKAKSFAEEHGIPVVMNTYSEVIADPQIDAIYIPLPNSLHAEWSIKAMQAGKHVLCEKPIANNKEDAQRILDVSRETGKFCVEAFHYVYHPLMHRIQAILDSGVLGEITHFESEFSSPTIKDNNIRFDYDLGGGAIMDMGCYPINILRRLSGQEPSVDNAEAILLAGNPQIDQSMRADFNFPSGASGTVRCAMRGNMDKKISLKVVGALGELEVDNPFLPHLYHQITVNTIEESWTEKLDGDDIQSTYYYQLRDFAEAILNNDLKTPTGLEDGIKNMEIIDQVYTKAGLKQRGT